MSIINGRIILKIIIFGLIYDQYLTASILPVNSNERRAPILNDALTTNETLAAGRNAFLMSHLFERINLKTQQQQQKMLMNETGRRNSLFFDDCPQWLPNLIEDQQNQNLIEATTISQTNFENKILEENTTMIATTAEISKNFSLLNDENEATNPFIYPPTELTPKNNFNNKNNREDVQYPYWLKIVFFCVIGFGIAFFLLMFLIGIITRCENDTANSSNIEENVVQIQSTSRGFERNEASEGGKGFF
uniref:Uncharacterized protein n=1 Tax=Meloidogyne enterolobii TaxID=390850 RepID=A0A6V7UW16_MELEN|nr:unnamed protein product [Meloidogyne enterolobii]